MIKIAGVLLQNSKKSSNFSGSTAQLGEDIKFENLKKVEKRSCNKEGVLPTLSD
jgi:hypothetical protein